jgi:uncharacterized delta-60 repeat protein
MWSRPLAVVAAIGALGSGSAAAQAAPGDLDPSFGGGGAVNVPLAAVDVERRSDGRIVVFGGQACGSGKRSEIAARLLSDGRPDPRFRHAGYRCPANEGSDPTGVHAGALLRGDHIVAVGFQKVRPSSGRDQTALYGFRANGRFDRGFGRDGEQVRLLDSRSTVFHDVAISPGGGIVSAGDPYVTRHTSRGRIDTGFGDGGELLVRAGGQEVRVRAVAVQPDGRILVAGSGRDTQQRAVLVRLHPDGRRDRSFGGGDGHATAFGGTTVRVEDIALAPDGDIVVVGAGKFGNDGAVFVARWNRDGRLVRAFAEDGVARTVLGMPTEGSSFRSSEAHTALVDGAGRVVVGGSARFPDEDTPGALRDYAVIARYLPDGRLDPAFGEGGVGRYEGVRVQGLAGGGDDRVLAAVRGTPNVFRIEG